LILSYRYRLYPSRSQAAALAEMLADFADLYNAGLQQRIEAYRRRGVSVTYYMQSAELKDVREAVPELARWSFTAEQQCLRRLDKTYRAFFQRGHGFPRFRAKVRYHAAEFRVGDGLAMRKSGKLGFVGVNGEIRVRWHRELPNQPKSAILTRQCGKWYVLFHVKIEPDSSPNQNTVGIDLGARRLAALSTGEIIDRPNWTKRATRELKRKQRALVRCRRSSRTRDKRRQAVARLHERIANRRRDHLHKVARDLVRRFGRIAIEKLNVKALLSQPYMGREISDASWAQLTAMLTKLKTLGASLSRSIRKALPKPARDAWPPPKRNSGIEYTAALAAVSLDRDVAAAQIVHYRAFNFWPGTGRGASSETDASKLAPEAVCFS
jgi:putative transposase